VKKVLPSFRGRERGISKKEKIHLDEKKFGTTEEKKDHLL